MAYNFKNLNEVERQDKPTENTTVMSFEAGQPKQIPASEFGGKGLVVDLRAYTVTNNGIVVEDMSYDPIYEAIMAGQNVVFQVREEGINDAFMSPILSVLVPEGSGPEAGFIVFCGIMSSSLSIQFTNGSYHTTA